MAADQQFSLKWNNHQSTLISVFDTLLANGQLVDCTIAAEGQFVQAHKIVLSACSPYLELLLSQHYEKHPIVILKDVKFKELKSMMDYMYKGEVNISQEQLATFLKAAESLQIKGLTDSGDDSRDVGSTKRIDGPAQNARKPAAIPASQPSRSPAVLNPSSSGLMIEHGQPSPHRSRDSSSSPTRKRSRRQRRQSVDDNQLSDSHIESSNNSCDLPSQSVSSVPAPTTSAVTLAKSLETEQMETENVNRLGSRINSNASMETVLKKEKVEPPSELIEPKTEYLDESNQDDVEDLTLDDDDDFDVNGSGIAGPSNQGFSASWDMQGDQSGTDEVLMAAQEAVGAHQDSQDWDYKLFASSLTADSLLRNPHFIDSTKEGGGTFTCCKCMRVYRSKFTLWRHLRYICGKEPKFSCKICPRKEYYKTNIVMHLKSKHWNLLKPINGVITGLENFYFMN